MKCFLSFNDSVSDFIREVVSIEFDRQPTALFAHYITPVVCFGCLWGFILYSRSTVYTENSLFQNSFYVYVQMLMLKKML